MDANFPDSTEILKAKLVQQFYSPVRWIDTIQKIEDDAKSLFNSTVAAYQGLKIKF